MLRRVVSTAAMVALLGASPALAGDEPVLPCPPRPQAQADGQAPGQADGARWPAALQKRNARYASLTRVDDPQGDLHERLIAHMDLVRVDDRLGDLEELRRKRAASHVPPRVVVHARVTRDQDLGGDEGEVILASITNERRHAETRRFRDLAGDHDELVVYQREVRSRGPMLEREDVIRHAKDRENPLAQEYLLGRNDMFRERELEGGEERPGDEERQMGFGRDPDEHDDREDRQAEAALDAAAEAAEAAAEQALENLDAATEKSAEQLEERMLERQTELQNEREESNTSLPQ